MARTSTNALTVKRLRDLGWQAECVQQWRGVVRRDLFNIVDVLAIGRSATLAVQACSSGTLAEHRTKALKTGMLPKLLDAGWSFVLWEWKKSSVPPGTRRQRGRAKAEWWYRAQAYDAGGFSDPTEWCRVP